MEHGEKKMEDDTKGMRERMQEIKEQVEDERKRKGWKDAVRKENGKRARDQTEAGYVKRKMNRQQGVCRGRRNLLRKKKLTFP